MKCKRLISCLVIVLIICVIMTAIPTQTDAANTLYWPVPGHTTISQYYHSEHAGIDLSDGSIAGAQVIAAMGGTVHKIWLCTGNHTTLAEAEACCNGFGTGLVIYGNDGKYYQYAHMQPGSIPANVYYGATVAQGAMVGRVGNSGYSFGNHLHFQICTVNWYTGAVDPLSFSYTHTNPVVTYENLGDDFYARIRYPATGHPISNVNNNVQLGGTGTLEEIWRFVRDSNGSYKIISVLDGQYMSVQGNSTENFANICCSPDNGGQANQRFYIQRSNSGYSIVAANSLKVLDVYNGANSVWGENVQLYSSLGTVDQVFNIEIIGCNVSYDANGGSGAPGVQLKWYDQPLTLSSTIPTRDGWTFMGWAESADATEAVYPAGGSYDVNTTTNTTLYAVWQPASYNGFKYSISNGEVTITGYTGDATELCIPDTINNYPVTAIDTRAFVNCTSLLSVNIPYSVTSIGVNAFSDCSNLAAIWVDEGNRYYCSDAAGVLYNKDKSVLIRAGYAFCGTYEIPDSVKIIEKIAFERCKQLTGITIPDSVQKIGQSAFVGCFGLTGVVIPDSVTEIGDAAFHLCKTMKYVKLSNSLNTIPFMAFESCYALQTVVIPENVSVIGEGAFGFCNSLSTVILPKTVVTLGSGAFNYGAQKTIYYSGTQSQWEAIVKLGGAAYGPAVPDKTTIICDYEINPALYYLDYTVADDKVIITGYTGSAAEVVIPDTIAGMPVTAIGDSAFCNNTTMTKVVIPEGVTHIEDSAFRGCNQLESVSIPDSVSEVGEWAFEGCDKLQYNIYHNGKYLGSINNPYWALVEAGYSNRHSAAVVILPDSTEFIMTGAFKNCTTVSKIYYCGTPEKWDSITLLGDNDPVFNVTLLYHSYNEGVITVQPTFTTDGQQQKTCSLCGDVVTETIDKLVGEVAYWNISLQNDFKVNFYLQVSESIENTAKVKLIVGNDTETYNVSALEKTADGYYLLSADIAATQLNELIIVMVINGREIGSTATYTVRQYCDTILSDEKHSAYHALVKEMLNYGAMAQVYFNYDTENLANDGITGVAATEVPETAEEITVGDRISGLNFYGASLVYRDRIAVRYYFTGDVTGCTFTANGSTYTPVAKDGMFYIEIADILPQNLDQQIALTVTDTEGNTLTVSYGPMNYVVRMNQKGNEAVKNLVKALYNYHLAAKALKATA